MVAPSGCNWWISIRSVNSTHFGNVSAGVLFSKSRVSNENGGKPIMKPFEFRELLRENLHGTVHEALKEVTTDMSEFFKYTAVISILRIASLSY